MLVQALRHFAVGKDIFDTGLRIVKVSLDGDHAQVVAGLRCHLEFLHAAHTVYRVEDHDLHPIHIAVALQCRLSRVA